MQHISKHQSSCDLGVLAADFSCSFEQLVFWDLRKLLLPPRVSESWTEGAALGPTGWSREWEEVSMTVDSLAWDLLFPITPMEPREQPQTEPALLISQLMQPPQLPPQRGGVILTL